MTLAPEVQTSGNAVQNEEARLPIARLFTRPEIDPYDEIEWELRAAVIAGADGTPVFEQRDVEFPRSWSQNATNVVASKYFRGPLVPTPGLERERSVKQLIDRIVNQITDWGWNGAYFADEEERETFRAELKFALVNQLLCFNSPVWFNVGQEEQPQCSACFILSIEDSIDSILEWYRTEGKIFKGGSGSGINLSALRSSREHVTAGGLASGPVSFMRGADSVAGTIKSGGKTRRAAKMVVLNVDHPDIEEFIWSKAKEERKAYALGEAGYDMSLDGDAWISIQYQNANNSVRVTDDFMQAMLDDGDWHTRFVTGGRVADTIKARKLMHDMAQAGWECADPGIQYHTTINDWHTCPHSGPINASNPCSEYMHLDDSACNLASINVLRFLGNEDEGPGRGGSRTAPTAEVAFDIHAYKHVVALSIMAQEIIVGNSSYPTEKIWQNALDYRQLGLGYSNLGALLMSLGIPYDSDEGRAWAGALTAIMTGHAYAASARIAARMGPFAGYEKNAEPMLGVIEKHRQAAYGIPEAGVQYAAPLRAAARTAWDEALDLGREHGYRNAQATVIAPTGTISFMMDCDTTGIEPDIALVKYKTLVGGGLMKIVNGTVPRALRHLGYPGDQVDAIIAHIDETGTIEGAPYLLDEHLPVFDCAFKAQNGERTIHWLGHIKMMGAVQPFISGAISKTVNLPEDATVEDIEQAYIEGWKQGLKALAIYRDGSKRAQVLSTKKDNGVGAQQPGGGDMGPAAPGGAGGRTQDDAAGPAAPGGAGDAPHPVRRRLPATRMSITHKFSIEGHEGYINAGMFEDPSTGSGRAAPGEIFVTMAKEGSTLSGMMDAFATSISLALQYGVPLRDLVNKFSHMRFEPSGRTENAEIPVAQSIVDYIFRWLASQFLSEEEKEEFGVLSPAVKAKLIAQEYLPRRQAGAGNGHGLANTTQTDAPPCTSCGWIMTRCGTCYRCDNCGTTTGCG
ncbi:MAG: vitamin B12-dependent ribonucleotide reductase [Dehalococcoidia bacterium]|nr:vitamin B12-dependent ribonucleotide reductase [Dehalococcoidia bacterium]